MDVLKNLYLAKGQIDVCRYYISLPSVAWRLALQQRCEAYPDQFICTLDPENFLAMQRSVCGGLAFVNKRIIKEGDPLKINVIDPRKVEKMVEIQVYDCNSMYATGRNLRKWTSMNYLGQQIYPPPIHFRKFAALRSMKHGRFLVGNPIVRKKVDKFRAFYRNEWIHSYVGYFRWMCLEGVGCLVDGIPIPMPQTMMDRGERGGIIVWQPKEDQKMILALCR